MAYTKIATEIGNPVDKFFLNHFREQMWKYLKEKVFEMFSGVTVEERTSAVTGKRIYVLVKKRE